MCDSEAERAAGGSEADTGKRRRPSFVFARTAAIGVGGALLALGGWFGESSTRMIVGNPAPTYRAITLDGDSVDLATFVGRPVVLNIWATWCEPCREEMPSLERLHETFRDEGLAVVAVSVDAAPPGFVRENYEARRVKTFMDAYDLHLPVWLDPAGRVEEAFRTMGVPTTLLIGRDGTVDNVVVGGVDWDDDFYQGLVLDIVGS